MWVQDWEQQHQAVTSKPNHHWTQKHGKSTSLRLTWMATAAQDVLFGLLPWVPVMAQVTSFVHEWLRTDWLVTRVVWSPQENSIGIYGFSWTCNALRESATHEMWAKVERWDKRGESRWVDLSCTAALKINLRNLGTPATDKTTFNDTFNIGYNTMASSIGISLMIGRWFTKNKLHRRLACPSNLIRAHPDHN